MTEALSPIPTDPTLLKLLFAVYRRLATDDRTGGEGGWVGRIDPNGTSRVALPPAGTHEGVVKRLGLGVVADLGGGHVTDVWVDPSDHSKGRRLGLVVDGPWVDPGGAAPAALAEGTGDAERYPAPAGPAGPKPGPPPAQDGPEG